MAKKSNKFLSDCGGEKPKKPLPPKTNQTKTTTNKKKK